MEHEPQSEVSYAVPGEPAAATELAQKRVLIVEDDAALARFLQRELALKDCTAVLLHDGEAALKHLETATYDFAILDLNLPKMDGMEVLGRIRGTRAQLPIVVLTARNRTEDRVRALERGADDCVIKPFSVQELLARIGNVLRRHGAAPGASGRPPNLVIHRDEHRVMRGTRRIDLTPREFSILELLVENAGKPVSRMTLMREVWNVPYDPTTNIVDVYMKYLRDKIDHEGEPKLIRTIRGVGYVLNDE